MNEKFVRLAILLAVIALHVVLIFFMVFNYNTDKQEASEHARVMKLTDLAEAPPPPQEEIPQVEAIAETMIETDIPPVQTIVAAGTFLPHSSAAAIEYLPMHRVSTPPRFDETGIAADLVYPPIALRSGIEGRVILELFVDSTGTVREARILQETPEGRGFGEAAVRAFMGRKGNAAIANGQAVSCRYRYPVAFRLR
jgi:protein TonB